MSVEKSERTIFVLSNEEIKCDEIYDGVWTGTRELRSLIPRRKWPEKIYRSICDYQGQILNLDGTIYDLPNDEEIFSDSDFRWLDNSYLAINENGKRRFYRSKLIERIRILDLYFQIAFPMTIARSYR